MGFESLRACIKVIENGRRQLKHKKLQFEAFAAPLIKVVNYVPLPGETIWDVVERYKKTSQQFVKDMESLQENVRGDSSDGRAAD